LGGGEAELGAAARGLAEALADEIEIDFLGDVEQEEGAVGATQGHGGSVRQF
jgi:hypothetical protein